MIYLMITLESEEHKDTTLKYLEEGEENGPLLFSFGARVLNDNEVPRILGGDWSTSSPNSAFIEGATIELAKTNNMSNGAFTYVAHIGGEIIIGKLQYRMEDPPGREHTLADLMKLRDGWAFWRAEHLTNHSPWHRQMWAPGNRAAGAIRQQDSPIGKDETDKLLAKLQHAYDCAWKPEGGDK